MSGNCQHPAGPQLPGMRCRKGWTIPRAPTATGLQRDDGPRSSSRAIMGVVHDSVCAKACLVQAEYEMPWEWRMGAFMLRIACCLTAPGANDGTLASSFRMILSASFCCNSSIWRTTRPILQGMSSAPTSPTANAWQFGLLLATDPGDGDPAVPLTTGYLTDLHYDRLDSQFLHLAPKRHNR